MTDDPELTAMNNVYEALKDLDEGGRARVIDWASNRFALSPVKKPQRDTMLHETVPGSSGAKELTSFATVAECFGAAKPESTADKTLVVAAYLQKNGDGSDISGREINKELTHMGHGVENITRAVAPLTSAKPQLLIQTRKEGKTQQAQKKYRVTIEGFARVSTLLAGTKSEE